VIVKLWDKGTKIDQLIEDFTVGSDYLLDQALLTADCQGSIAHARTLERAGILTAAETARLIQELETIERDGLTLRKEDEDVHTALENVLCARLGDLGKKIHTGRSRNDQVMVDLQLWSRGQLQAIHAQGLTLAETINEFARQHPDVMPGYTHMQRAMPSSIPLLAGSYIESLLDDLCILETAMNINNVNPLGSAAGYGSSLNLDRDYTAQLLGFHGSRNPIYVQNRPKLMSIMLFSLAGFMKTLDKIAADLLLFTMAEFRFFSLPEAFCTGSSIMPQKKNYDVLELTRAKAAQLHGLLASVEMLGSKLPSGYNRDYQLTKGPLFEAVRITSQSLAVMTGIFQQLEVNSERLRQAISPELFATDRAYELVQAGTPFRTAYLMVAQNLDQIVVPDDIMQDRDFLRFRDYTPEITQHRP
jgi:argininosuccinate lyase